MPLDVDGRDVRLDQFHANGIEHGPQRVRNVSGSLVQSRTQGEIAVPRDQGNADPIAVAGLLDFAFRTEGRANLIDPGAIRTAVPAPVTEKW